MSQSERIVVAMSGGVDSSVVAALLTEQGHDVVGLFMRNGVVPGAAAEKGKQGCCSLHDSMDARHVASRLGVSFFAVDFKREFGRIINYFADEYDRGRTPNPCVLCNRDLKFGRLLDYADEVGAQKVATGHYARVGERHGRPCIERARDDKKDQSYVLFPLTTEQVARTLLPLGGMTKDEVREEARRFNLPVAEKKESQEICFVPDNDYRNLLRKMRPDNMVPGPLVNVKGEEVGRHEGHQMYTIGQRKGLGGGHGEPVYVVAIDAEHNAVIIGGADDLMVAGLRMSAPTWQGIASLEGDDWIFGEVQIRYNHTPVPARARMTEDGDIEVRFTSVERAVTPGQAAVFFADGQILFGGWIDAAIAADSSPRVG